MMDERTASVPIAVPRWQKTLGLVVAFAALVAAVIAVVAPVTHQVARLSWNSSVDPNPAVLAPVAPVAVISVVGDAAPDALTEPVVIDTAFFDTMADDQSRAGLRVVMATDGLSAQLLSPSGQVRESVGPLQVGGATGGFPSAWQVSVENSEIVLVTSSERVSSGIAEDRVVVANWAAVAGSLGSGSVTIDVQLAGGILDSADVVHSVAVLVAVVLVVTVLLLHAFQRPRSARRLAVRRMRFHLRWTDAAVLATLLFSAVVSRTTYDDGWLIQLGRSLASRVWGPGTPFVQVYGDSVPLPTGFLYTSLLGWTAGQTTVVVGMRSLTILFLFGTWIVLSRMVIPRLLPGSGTGITLAAAAYMALFGLGWMTVRAEIPVVFLSALFVALALSETPRNFVIRLVGLSSIAAAAIATHPVGFLLLPGLVLLVVSGLLKRDISLFDKMTALVTGAAAGIVLMFFNQTWALFRSAYAGIGDESVDPFDEWGRFSDMMRMGTIAQRAWFLAGLLGLVALWMVATKTLLHSSLREARSLAILAVALMPFGLAFSGSKWAWHYAALFVPMMIGLLFGVDWLSRPANRRSQIGMIAIGVMLWMALAAKDSEFDHAWAVPLAASAGVIGLVGASLGRWDVRTRVGAAMSGVVLLTGMVTFWHSLDLTLRSPTEWSFLKQSTVGIVDPALRCGMSSVIPVEAEGESRFAQEVIDDSGFAALVYSDFVLQNPCLFPPDVVDGGSYPSVGSVLTDSPDSSAWLHDDVLRSGCIDVAGPGTYVYSYCFRETLPPGTPQILPVIVE